MKEVKCGDTVLARLIREEDISAGLNFFSDNDDFVQVGMWQDYENGRVLQAHIHNQIEKTANRTHEVLYVIKGRVQAFIYNLDEMLVEQFEVCQGEILILLECGHGYVIKEDGTRVLEMKNGPYYGADADRRRI